MAYLENELAEARARIASLERELAEARASKDGAYSERDRLVAALSKLIPSFLARHPDTGTEWDDDWRWIVFVDAPAGQLSWHIHESELQMFDHLERLEGEHWDGHTTTQKYERLAALDNFMSPDDIDPLPETPERTARKNAVRRAVVDPDAFTKLSHDRDRLAAAVLKDVERQRSARWNRCLDCKHGCLQTAGCRVAGEPELAKALAGGEGE